MFFSFLARSRYLSLLSLSFSFNLWSVGTAKSTIRNVPVFFFFFFLLCLRTVVWPVLNDPFVSQNLKEFWASHFLEFEFCIPFVHMVKFELFAQFPVDHLPHPVVYIVLYSFCATSLHSLIMWSVVSSLSLNNLHLLFYCVLSTLALTLLVPMAFIFCFFLLCTLLRQWKKIGLIMKAQLDFFYSYYLLL